MLSATLYQEPIYDMYMMWAFVIALCPASVENSFLFNLLKECDVNLQECYFDGPL